MMEELNPDPTKTGVIKISHIADTLKKIYDIITSEDDIDIKDQKYDLFYSYLKKIYEEYEKEIENQKRSYSYSDRGSSRPETITFSNDFKNVINNIQQSLKPITFQYKILNEYVRPKIYFINETDDSVINSIKSDFSDLYTFSQSITELSRLKSSNLTLQKSIDNLIKGKDRKSFVNLIQYIRNKIVERSPIGRGPRKIIDMMYTGIGLINELQPTKPQYEIYIGMDLIKGELTSKLIPQINCVYMGHVLGQKASMMLKNNDNIDFVYLSLEELQKKAEARKTKKKPEPVAEKKGGQHRLTRKKYNMCKMKKVN
jgi:hypothetical protein